MAFLIDAAKDAALAYVITNGTRIDYCSQEPTTYAEATSTYSLANKSGITMAAASDYAGSGAGRQTTQPTIEDAVGTASGTATHWALTDNSATLVATGALASSLAIADEAAVTFTGVAVVINDATAA